MEGIQEFLLLDEGLDILPIDMTTRDMDDTNLNVDEWWDMEFPIVSEFESEILSIMKDEYFLLKEQPAEVTVNNEEDRDLLSHLYLQPGEQRKQRQPEIQLEEGEQQHYQQPQGQQVNEEIEEEEEDTESDDKKSNEANSKNLQSERNRRKRLNQQLFRLRSLVPNITKMDKRSILVDALAYLQSLLTEIEKEMENSNLSSEPSSSSSSKESDDAQQVQPNPYERSVALPVITKANAEMLDDSRFVLEISCNKARGALGQVQLSIEMLGVEITCSSVTELKQERMLTTAFVRVKKKGIVTPAKLLNRLRINLKQLGFHLLGDS